MLWSSRSSLLRQDGEGDVARRGAGVPAHSLRRPHREGGPQRKGSALMVDAGRLVVENM
jgi:hypothetical protein